MLDLKPLLTQTQERAGVGGRLAEKLPGGRRPDHDPEVRRARSWPRTSSSFFETFAVLLVILALGLFALAVYLARGWRREALRACGIGFVVAGAGALIARSLAGGRRGR